MEHGWILSVRRACVVPASACGERSAPPAQWSREDRMNVLLVGSYRPLLETLARALREEGHGADLGNSDGTGSGATYDVVILDLAHRGRADLSLLRDLRRDDSPKPRILVLASPDRID